MRTKILLSAALVVALAGCGSSAKTTSPPTSSAGGATATSVGSANTKASGSSSLDCAEVKAAAGEIVVWVQLLAQLKSADAVASIKSKDIGNLDIDKFLADMQTLHALDSYSSALGSPKKSIDVYEKAGQAAKVLFATDPVDQAALDTYNQNVGDVGTFLGYQGPIAAAIDSAHC